MVYGYHLFLEDMPTCFRFREEDMNSLPSWIQIKDYHRIVGTGMH